MWVLLLLGVGRVWADCLGDPHTIERPSPFVHELRKYGTVPRLSPETAARHRRDTVDGAEPVLSLDIDTETLSDREQWAVGLGYKALLLLYTSPRAYAVDTIRVVGSPETIGATGGGVLVGSANFATNTITMYTKNIPNTDAFLLVLLHEFFHLLGFGTLASPDARSFQDRVDPLTLRVDAPSIAHCTHAHMDAPLAALLYSDRGMSHWNASNSTWDDDLMLPTIQFDATAMSVCTAQMVVLSRPEWKSLVCTKDDDCPTPQTCQTLGRHWLKVCQNRPVAGWSRPLDTGGAFVQFVVFSAVVAVLWIGILACHRRPLDLYKSVWFV